jgi:hypothetical protein
MVPIHCRLILLATLQSASLDPVSAGLIDMGDTMNCEKFGSCACKQTGRDANNANPMNMELN